MTDSVFKMTNSVFKMTDYVFKMMNFVFNMIEKRERERWADEQVSYSYYYIK